jgi:hypothetical protein
MMSLPAALADLGPHPRWVVWRWIERTPGAKPDKPLFRARDPRRYANTQDPASWAIFDAAARCVGDRLADGLGYVLRDDARLIALDLDNCRDAESGEIAPWAAELVETCDTYTEVTPSGRGLRIIGLNETLLAPIHRQVAMPDGGRVEIYHRCPRYITVSGRRLPEAPDRLRAICDTTVELLRASSPGGADPDAPAPEPNPDAAGSPEDIAAALAAMPNADLPWDEWSRIGMAAFRASGGSAGALEAWTAWSAKSRKHADGACAERWAHWRRSPPTRLGFGTLYHEARRANPLWVPPSRTMAAAGNSATQAPWDATPHPAPRDARQAPQAPVLALLTADEAIALAPPRWLVRDLIPEGALMVLYGPPGAGKSFLALDIAMRLAHGMAWRGQPLPRRDVVYLAAEGGGGFGARIEAWSRHNAMDGSDSGFRLLRATVDLLNTEGVAAFAATLRAACDAAGLRPALFVLDTLARCMAGGDENEARDMGAAIRGVGAIQEALDGAAALVVHHPGKDKDRGPRGSYALVGAADAIALVERVGEDGIRLTVEKQKDAEDGQRMEFRRVAVPLPTRGLEARSSLAVEPRDDQLAAEAAPSARLTITGRLALRMFERALSKHGMPAPGSANIPQGVAVLNVEDWRREFYAGAGFDDPESRRRAFTRARQELLAKQVIAAHGDFAWVVSPIRN